MAAHGRTTRVDAELLGVFGDPDKAGVGIVDLGGVWILWPDSGGDADHHDAELRDPVQLNVGQRESRRAENLAPVGGVVEARQAPGAPGWPQNERRQLGCAFRSGDGAFLELDRPAVAQELVTGQPRREQFPGMGNLVGWQVHPRQPGVHDGRHDCIELWVDRRMRFCSAHLWCSLLGVQRIRLVAILSERALPGGAVRILTHL